MRRALVSTAGAAAGAAALLQQRIFVFIHAFESIREVRLWAEGMEEHGEEGT